MDPHSPIVIETEFNFEHAVGEWDEGHVRSAGAHCSDIIRDLDNRLINKGQRKHSSELTNLEKKKAGLFWQNGFIWEGMVERELAARNIRGVNVKRRGTPRDIILHQMEIELDGIFMTLDAFDPIEECLEEYKATYKSSDRIMDQTDFWSFFIQMKAYCWGLTNWIGHLVNHAHLYVWFICGNHKGIGPVAKAYEIEFDGADLQRNWNMLLQHKELMTQEGKFAAKEEEEGEE